jgi:hypothetical protein
MTSSNRNFGPAANAATGLRAAAADGGVGSVLWANRLRPVRWCRYTPKSPNWPTTTTSGIPWLSFLERRRRRYMQANGRWERMVPVEVLAREARRVAAGGVVAGAGMLRRNSHTARATFPKTIRYRLVRCCLGGSWNGLGGAGFSEGGAHTVIWLSKTTRSRPSASLRTRYWASRPARGNRRTITCRPRGINACSPPEGATTVCPTLNRW